MKGKKTGGRVKGTANKKTREIADRAAAEGLTPLEYMIAIMRDDAADPDRRDRMAIACAPYIHPRLQAMTVRGEGEDGAVKFIVVGS